MAGFRVPCPSCDNPVQVQDIKLVGTKIECPKCKYRFKVEAPKDMPPAEPDEKAGKDKKDKGKKGKKGSADAAAKPEKKAKAAGKGKPNKKMLIGAGLGVLAVALLAVGGIMILGGKDEKPKPKGTFPIRQNPPVAQKIDSEEGDPAAKKETDPKPATPPPIVLATSDKNPSNLLPGETRAVVHVDLEKLRRTPLYNVVADGPVLEVFKTSLGIDPENVSTYTHAYVDGARRPFGVLRIKTPMAEKDMVAKASAVAGPQSPIQGKSYLVLKSNAFLDAMGKLMSVDALMGGLLSPAVAKAETPRPLALCAYDTQTLLIGDQLVLEGFLKSLQPDGYPPFKTEYTKPEGPKIAPPAPKENDPNAPPNAAAAPPVPPKNAAVPEPKPAAPDPKAAPATAAAPAGPKRLFSSNPDYRTITPALKVILNGLEPEDKAKPMCLVGELHDANERALDPLRFSTAVRPWATAASAALVNATAFGIAVREFTDRDLGFQLVMESANEEEARRVKEKMDSTFPAAFQAVNVLLGHKVELEGLVDPMPLFPPGGPGGEGGAIPPPMPPPPGSPMGLPGLPGSPFPMDANLPVGPSKLSVTLADRTLTLHGDFEIKQQTYLQHIWPQLQVFANQFRSRMLVLSGSAGWQAFVPVVPRITAQGGSFPRGTAERPAGLNRFGLAYPPMTRVSFFNELLPHLGKGDIYGSIDPKLAWYDKHNLAGAEEWVPEFLVPYYPASSWRATSPYAEGRSLGGTNIVGVAGIGRDAARYNPADPVQAKRVGITGYDWGSKLSEVTDGASNTMYLIQVAPHYSRPWIAGGGATLVGVDDKQPNPTTDFTYSKNGKPGTHALMADGSVRWISTDINREVFLGMATRAGGETLGDLDKIAPKDDGTKIVEMKAVAAPVPTPAPAPGPKEVPALPAPKAVSAPAPAPATAPDPQEVPAAKK